MFLKGLPSTTATWPLVMLSLGILTLIVLSGLLSGVDAALRDQIVAASFWLLLFTLTSVDAATLWAEDAADGSLDQAFVNAGGSYLPLIGRALGMQIMAALLPLSLVFMGLWALGVSAAPVPWLSLIGLWLPLASLRLMASALALGVQRRFAIGSLFFLGLGSIFLLAAVAGRADLIWALGLIFAPLCLACVPATLVLSQQSL